MNLHTSKIIYFKLVKKGMFQGDLERKVCELLIENLTNQENVKIKLFLSDKRKGIIYGHSTLRLNMSLIYGTIHPDVVLCKSSINNHFMVVAANWPRKW